MKDEDDCRNLFQDEVLLANNTLIHIRAARYGRKIDILQTRCGEDVQCPSEILLR